MVKNVVGIAVPETTSSHILYAAKMETKFVYPDGLVVTVIRVQNFV